MTRAAASTGRTSLEPLPNLRPESRNLQLGTGFPPVPGWDAIPTKILMQSGEREQSYNVLRCPLFVEPKSRQVKDVIKRKMTKIVAVNIETGETKEYATIMAAARDGFSGSEVCKCVLGQEKAHKGYTFERVEVSHDCSCNRPRK